jgi:protocatechuate 3,4-dioxygenase beta subunit
LGLIVAVGPALSGGMGAAQAAGSASSAAPPVAVTISGKTVNLQGGPVEGAKVTVYQMIYSDTGSMPTTEALGDKNTGADGTFTLTVTPGADPYQYGYVVARKEGLALGWAMWRGQVREPAEIILGEPKDLAGEVVDEQGRPLAEADVSIAMAMMGRPEDRRYLSSPGFLSAKTDASGRFVFAAMPAEATFELLAQKPGRAAVGTFDRTAYRGTRYQFAPGQTGIKLTLPPEARIEGVAVEKVGGKPVAGVRLMAQSDPRQGAVLFSKPATTADDGVFRIGGLAPGAYVVRLPAAPRGQTLEWVAEPVRVSLKARETMGNIKLQLAKGGIVEVRVKDDAGKPIASASVSLRHTQLEEWMGGTTDPNGLARMRVPPGRYSFSGAYKEGYGRQMSQEEVAVEEGETKRIESVLNTLPKVAGVVRDEAGNPLAGVKVEVKPSGREEITTDASGKFEAAWDPTSWNSGRTTFVVVARDETRNLAEAAEIDEQAGSLDVKLRPAVSITGTVLDEEGKPLPGARLRVMLRVSNWGSTLGRREPVAGPDGKFEIKALPPERKYTVTALADGYGKQDVTVDASDFKDNRHDTGELRLPLANLSITGVVVDANDKPVAGAAIYGYSQGQQPDVREIFTDAEGKFTIKGVCAGPIRLQANSRGPTAMYGSAQAEGGATDLRIVISQRPTSQPYMPRRPTSLKGKPLPPLKDVGIDLPAAAADKMLLVCFWDMGQRPSRYCLTQLAGRTAQLRDQGVEIVAVHAAQVEGDALSQWLETNKVPFKTGTIAGDVEKTKFAWGAASLPHLILTDQKHVVVAEGLGLNELDKQLEAMAGR